MIWTFLTFVFVLRFMLKHCDRDLLLMLESGAPPPDLTKIPVFAATIKRYEKQARQVCSMSLKLYIAAPGR